MLILFLGLFYLFKTLQLLLNDNFWAIIVPLLMFTSPALVYYGNNYLSNVSSLAFVFIAWYHFVKYLKTKRRKSLLWMMSFFLLGGIFKLPALMSLFAITGYLLLKVILKKPFKNQPEIKHKLGFFTGLGFVLLIIGAWVMYANLYNARHACYYFSTTIFPVWNLNGEEIKELLQHVWTHWRIAYFHDSMHLIFLASLIFSLLHIRKLRKMHLAIGIFLGLQFIFFVFLQFQTFKNHDYYTINLNILPLFILVTALLLLSKQYPKIFQSLVFKIIFVGLLAVNIYHAASKQRFRHEGWPNKYYQLKADIYSIEPYLRELEITPEDKVIFIPDGTNVSLYLMNQPGWTQYTDARFNRAEPIRYNQDSASIKASINRGAKYLIVNNVSDLETYEYIKSFTHHLEGKYRDVLIFNLQDSTRNFFPDKKPIIDSIFCDLEQIHQEKFVCVGSEYGLGNAKKQSNEHAFEGLFSCKVFNETPYALAFELPMGAKSGEVFTISVWRYGSEKGQIVASADDASFFYLNNFEIVDSQDGWGKLQLSFSIPENMENRHLKIYLYNPDTNPAWFDNYRIIRYASPFSY